MYMDLKWKKKKSEKCHKWAFGDDGSYFFPRTDQRMKKHNLSVHISLQDPTGFYFNKIFFAQNKFGGIFLQQAGIKSPTKSNNIRLNNITNLWKSMNVSENCWRDCFLLDLRKRAIHREIIHLEEVLGTSPSTCLVCFFVAMKSLTGNTTHAY
jgi:hypothetical protein